MNLEVSVFYFSTVCIFFIRKTIGKLRTEIEECPCIPLATNLITILRKQIDTVIALPAAKTGGIDISVAQVECILP